MALALAGCARPPASGLEGGGVGRYAHVTFVPLIADEVRMEWGSATEIIRSDRQLVGWKTQMVAGRIAAELLAPAGTEVTLIEDPRGTLLGPEDQTDWVTGVWRRLKASGRIKRRGPVMLFRQNALDAQGRQYNPAANFLAFGLVGIVIGAVNRKDNFQPAFMLAMNEGLHETFVGKSRCSIGFDARLLDGNTGEILASSDDLLGQELFPLRLPITKWLDLSADQRDAVQTYCVSALRRGISQALNDLALFERR